MGPFADEDVAVLLLAQVPRDVAEVLVGVSVLRVVHAFGTVALPWVLLFQAPLLRVFDRRCHPFGLFTIPADLEGLLVGGDRCRQVGHIGQLALFSIAQIFLLLLLG